MRAGAADDPSNRCTTRLETNNPIRDARGSLRPLRPKSIRPIDAPHRLRRLRASEIDCRHQHLTHTLSQPPPPPPPLPRERSQPHHPLLPRLLLVVRRAAVPVRLQVGISPICLTAHRFRPVMEPIHRTNLRAVAVRAIRTQTLRLIATRNETTRRANTTHTSGVSTTHNKMSDAAFCSLIFFFSCAISVFPLNSYCFPVL